MAARVNSETVITQVEFHLGDLCETTQPLEMEDGLLWVPVPIGLWSPGENQLWLVVTDEHNAKEHATVVVYQGDDQQAEYQAQDGSSILIAGSGGGTLVGSDHSNLFVSGPGADYFIGGSHWDTYHFGLGDGALTILDEFGSSRDTLVLGSGIAEWDLDYAKDGDDLLFTFNDNDRIRFERWFADEAYQLNYVRFDDGKNLNVYHLRDAQDISAPRIDVDVGRLSAREAINAQLPVTLTVVPTATQGLGSLTHLSMSTGTSGATDVLSELVNDQYTLTLQPEHWSGNAAKLTVRAENDLGHVTQVPVTVLLGGEDGEDRTMRGGSGVNVFILGAGNDEMQSDFPSLNIYHFGRGTGSNSIGQPRGEGVIELGEGIEESDLLVRRDLSRFVFTLNTGETLVVEDMFNWELGGQIRMFAIRAIRFPDGTEWDFGKIREAALQPGNGINRIQGFELDDHIVGGTSYSYIRGGAGNDTLVAGSGGGTLYGEAGDDTLIASDGGDSLNGGEGDDWLIGGAGDDKLSSRGGDNIFEFGPGEDTARSYVATSNDVYRFDRDTGSNSIWDQGGEDVVELGEGVAESDLSLARYRTHFDFTLSTGETLRINDMFDERTGAVNAAEAIEIIRFADGAEWDIAKMREVALRVPDTNDGFIFYAFDGDDHITTGTGDDSVWAGAGDDTVISGGGADYIIGGAGNDTLIAGDGDGVLLHGDEGDDTLIGGPGDNTLRNEYTEGLSNDTYIAGGGDNLMYSGGAGDNIFEFGSGTDHAVSYRSNDVYRFGRGSGSNSIMDTGGEDVIELGEGIEESDLSVSRGIFGSILTLDTGETIEITMLAGEHLVEEDLIMTIRFADGTEWELNRKLSEDEISSAQAGR